MVKDSSRLYFALDLKEGDSIIAEYENWHRPDRIWPEVVEAIRAGGALELEIFRCGSRLVMVIEGAQGVNEKAIVPEATGNSRLQEWESLMWQYQQSLPFAKPGQKWVPMRRIFSLRDTVVGSMVGK